MDAVFQDISTTPIYSFAALKSKQREVKDAADRQVVHITENGNAAYIFCSEDVFRREKVRAINEAIELLEISDLIVRGQADISASNVTYGLEEGIGKMKKKWKNK